VRNTELTSTLAKGATRVWFPVPEMPSLWFSPSLEGISSPGLKRDYVIIDGAPGIGCSATSSIVGVNYVVVVTEPTMSGLHDLKRIVETLKCLKREFGIVINKYDINSVVSREIEDYCLSEGLDLLGKIPFDETVVRASVECKPVVTYENSPAAESIKKIVEKIIEKIS